MGKRKDYKVTEKIGEGAFGQAFLVENKESRCQYVMKKLALDRVGVKERQLAKLEAAVLSQLSHEYIVSFYDCFEQRGSLYIVMDYCSRGDLRKVIEKEQKLPESQILTWFAQLCLALKYVHDRKMLHRDIKPENIFLSDSGEIQLGDFGIVRVLNSERHKAVTMIGTPYYMAPEVFKADPYNNKADVWSTGCVLYELLFRTKPFDAKSIFALMGQVCSEPFRPMPEEYSAELRKLVEQMLNKIPEKRPSVKTILARPLLAERAREQLTEGWRYKEEFSHTVISDFKLTKRIPARKLHPPIARPRAPGSGLRKPTQADSAPRTDEVLDMLQITYKRNGGHGNRDHRERKHWDDEDPVRSLRKLLPKAEDKIQKSSDDEFDDTGEMTTPAFTKLPLDTFQLLKLREAREKDERKKGSSDDEFDDTGEMTTPAFTKLPLDTFQLLKLREAREKDERKKGSSDDEFDDTGEMTTPAFTKLPLDTFQLLKLREAREKDERKKGSSDDTGKKRVAFAEIPPDSFQVQALRRAPERRNDSTKDQPKPDARTLKKPDDETPADDDDMFCDCDILNDLDLFKRLEDGKAQLKKDLGSSLYSKINELMKGIQEKDDCDVVGEVQKVLEILGSQKEDMFASIFFLAMNDSLLGSPTG